MSIWSETNDINNVKINLNPIKPPKVPVFKEAIIVDDVNNPVHYTSGGVECIDALEAATVNLKGIEAVDTANAIKYLWRWKQKNGVEDLKKAIWYINHLIEKIEGEK